MENSGQDKPGNNLKQDTQYIYIDILKDTLANNSMTNYERELQIKDKNTNTDTRKYNYKIIKYIFK